MSNHDYSLFHDAQSKRACWYLESRNEELRQANVVGSPTGNKSPRRTICKRPSAIQKNTMTKQKQAGIKTFRYSNSVLYPTIREQEVMLKLLFNNNNSIAAHLHGMRDFFFMDLFGHQIVQQCGSFFQEVH
ncbi:hypothetical protein RvY_12999 [Ramazzottius varieornatus]|uniref:Uncharacterized protein n=1 Tax=Ramazzottius varieornatus TaxID=947166 RepID=A0A1D1VLD1_RAMVA|nr:hypothetical protein RvY_12999 [Ramazzottius varieornatus]